MYKRQGSIRWAIDYRALNLRTVADSFPTPRIDQVIACFAGSRVFSALDAAQAYHNIPVDPGSRTQTAFVCIFGLFQFARMPFGLKNAGAAYCRLVQALVDDLADPGIAAYLDDIIVHSADPDRHVDLLDKTLHAHVQAGIRLKAKKTILFEDAVDYLGFRISADGIGMTTKFIEQIRDWPQPKSGKELASALGFMGYYREFVKLFPCLLYTSPSPRD